MPNASIRARAACLLIVLSVSCSPGSGVLGLRREVARGEKPAPAAAPQASPQARAEQAAAPLILEPVSFSAPGVLFINGPGAGLAEAPGGAASGRLRGGVAVPFDVVQGGWARILTPCERVTWVSLRDARPAPKASVVLDPGHGGDEPGAVGPGGLSEKVINLPVTRKAAELLEAEGVPTLLTRYADYRATLRFRAEFAKAAAPKAMISIHHNASPELNLDRPGTETFYQYHSPESKRLSGLLYEEAVGALSPLKAQWVGNRDAGAKWRLGSEGSDYYGILRRTREAGVNAVLGELAFLSNPSEEVLLKTEEVQRLEAETIVRAVKRFLRTDDPGSGFVVPYPRAAPAGPGSGLQGCTDPA
ncbi:MAG: N-acetylmuramoyl-L-alanine amidase family protein [Actinomycetota bacterium]